jgi:hypothetical protein
MTPEQRRWVETWAEYVASSDNRFVQLIDFETWFDYQIGLSKNPIKEYNLADILERNDERLGE